MEIIDIVGYILKHYSNKNKLTKGRLNNLIYLSDWKSSIENERQLTCIQWKINLHGPYVVDIEKVIQGDQRISIDMQKNYYGYDVHLIKLNNNQGFVEPNEKDKKILDFVIEVTEKLNWNELINAVYSTYPIKHGERGALLDLVKLALEYNNSKKA